MLIKSVSAADVRESEVTPQQIYLRRREILLSAGASIAGLALGSPAIATAAQARAKLPGASSPLSIDEKLTPHKDVTGYNNFYEFGTEKSDPAKYAKSLQTEPWTVKVDGAVNKPRTFDMADLLKLAPMEERIYRLRCVEGWSMVVPWVGYSLSALIKAVEPRNDAKYVEFITLDDPKQMPGISYPVLRWPYVEGLRIDEANNPLALLAFGLYGEVMPKQNGAPLRLVVPWKYGFKSGKSLVAIRFKQQRPRTSWNVAAPNEYGFFSNVNPEVDHPRWSQATERRIGEDGFFKRKRKTLMFNGYAEQVASLYSGMDLTRDF
ncbi:MAG: protein-methionine-sulfoxide reductase catalytic subunit MsrP [Burkholderiaceae bacterium]